MSDSQIRDLAKRLQALRKQAAGDRVSELSGRPFAMVPAPR